MLIDFQLLLKWKNVARGHISDHRTYTCIDFSIIIIIMHFIRLGPIRSQEPCHMIKVYITYVTMIGHS